MVRIKILEQRPELESWYKPFWQQKNRCLSPKSSEKERGKLTRNLSLQTDKLESR